MFKFYFARVVARTIVIVAIFPLVWWYEPRALLAVINVNTAGVNMVVRTGISFAPEPWDHYGKRLLQIGDAAVWTIRKGLNLVPEEHRDRVEVLARVRYELGGWLMVGEFAAVLLGLWLWRRRQREKNKKLPPR